MTDINAKLLRLLARQDIIEVLARYARGVDRADAALWRSCYHPDAIEEHGSRYTGPAYDYIEQAIPRIEQMDSMAHYLCNSHVEFDGDTAYVETYALTFARVNEQGKRYDTFTGGRIIDRFEKRDDIWLIAHRKVVFDWNHDIPSAEGWCRGMFDPHHPAMNFGRKGRSDISYERF